MSETNLGPTLRIGIDVGINGGIAFLGKTVTHACIMPIIKGTKGKSKSVLDMPAIKKLLIDQCLEEDGHAVPPSGWWRPQDIIKVVAIEEQRSMPKQGVTSMFNLGNSFGLLRGLCLGVGFKVEIVPPKTWKGKILAGTAKDKTAAIVFARNHYSDIDLNVGVRKVIHHDGMADALCIATYAKLMRL